MTKDLSKNNPNLIEKLQQKSEILWLNPRFDSKSSCCRCCQEKIKDAQSLLKRSQKLLAYLFPQLVETNGVIESDLLLINKNMQRLFSQEKIQHQAIYLKADHNLPIAGSIKARGGFHEVLVVAEKLAIENGLIEKNSDLISLTSPQAKELFSEYTISVGSTGNLGLSIGVIAAALGFKAVVHMSNEAKEWKKKRLRDYGVKVVEHHGDYAQAVASGRADARNNSKIHFVDDEKSELLFWGYAACAEYLATQLKQEQRFISNDSPLIVYIPCGVGGAPGGICYGLKSIFGNAVHCFFAEPIASPCMLVQLATDTDIPLSVYDIGLDNKTEADGLAVGQASALVSPLMRTKLSGIFTVEDKQLFKNLYQLKKFEKIEVEPSATAALQGPLWLNSLVAKEYLDLHNINIQKATHVIWSTGGSLVPEKEMHEFQKVWERNYSNQ